MSSPGILGQENRENFILSKREREREKRHDQFIPFSLVLLGCVDELDLEWILMELFGTRVKGM